MFFKTALLLAVITLAVAQKNDIVDNSLSALSGEDDVMTEEVTPEDLMSEEVISEEFPEEDIKIIPTNIDIEKFRESFATKNVRERFLPSK